MRGRGGAAGLRTAPCGQRARPGNVRGPGGWGHLLLPSLLLLLASTSAARGPSVLLLIADDMRAPAGAPHLHLPNCDSLAGKGILFENAYAQQALCAPSRNSFLTSRRPNSLRLFDFYSYWREFSGNFTTLPQFFKENGYNTYSFGKVFHPGKSSNFTDDYPLSWSEPPYHPSTEKYKESSVCIDEETGKLSRNLICPVDVELQPEKTLPDLQITDAAIEKLKYLKENCSSCPFFMAVGFHKPHIPLKFPREYLDFYPLSNMSLPDMPFKPPTMPTVAWNPWVDVRKREDMKKLNVSFPFGSIPDKWSLKISQSYYASMTYIDDLIGNILKHVNMQNTIIVLTSDHGWSLGEHGEWAKYSNFDVALKVPLIFYIPQNNIHKHFSSNALVELVDLFPTLAELSGIVDKFPACPNNDTNYCTEGKSLLPIIDNLMNHKNITFNDFAFSQYPRPGIFPTMKPNSDEPRLDQINIMGYSVRTSRFRYTEWVSYNHTMFNTNWNNVYAKELYDHEIDDGENLNLENRPELREIQSILSSKLRSRFN